MNRKYWQTVPGTARRRPSYRVVLAFASLMLAVGVLAYGLLFSHALSEAVKALRPW